MERNVDRVFRARLGLPLERDVDAATALTAWVRLRFGIRCSQKTFQWLRLNYAALGNKRAMRERKERAVVSDFFFLLF